MQKQEKKRSGMIMFWAMLLTLALSLAYAPTAEAAAKNANVKSVNVTNLPSKTLVLKKGKTQTLKVKVESSSKKKVSQKVTYKSSNTKVATVSSKGKVKAKKNGKATITITSKANTKKNVKITVRVGTPVTKVSLNQTSAVVQTGKSLTLKASVKPKKPTVKGIVWSSSNSAVATVNSKGQVKAVKAGTAKITAEAADGSGKKASASITVKDPVVVQEVTVVNAATVKVTLSDVSDLTAASFAVKSNKYGGSKYNKVNKVDNIASTDKKTYLVVLDSKSQLSDHDHVQVTVTGLWGTPNSVGTAVFNDGTFQYTDERNYVATVGERFERTFTGEGYGYMAYAVTNLPKGILYEEVGNSIRFYGKPQQAGTVVTQVVVADEADNTYTYAITWAIGAEDTITATVSGEKYYLLDAKGIAEIGNYYKERLRVSGNGGSGSYKYSLTGTTYGLTIDESYGYIRGELRGRGDYTLNVRVEDRENAQKTATATVVIHVEQSVTVSGILKDLGGNPISSNNAGIRFINKDKANKFGTGFYAYPDDKGAFSATLVSGTYDIVASCGAGNGETTSYLYSQQLTTTRSGFDITLSVRKINVYSDNNSVLASELGEWEDAYGEVYGRGDYLYLKEGVYNLTSTVEGGRRTITATLTANTASATATAHVTVVDNTSTWPVISAGTPVQISALTSSYAYYKFTPAATGTYYFYSTDGIGDTYGTLENADGVTLANDDDSLSGNNFCYSYYCEAGTTYYVGIRVLNDSGSAVLNISTTNPQLSESEEEQQLYNDARDAAEEEAITDEVITEDAEVLPEEQTDAEESADVTAKTVDEAETPAGDNAKENTEEPAADNAVENAEEPEADDTVKTVDEAEAPAAENAA